MGQTQGVEFYGRKISWTQMTIGRRYIVLTDDDDFVSIKFEGIETKFTGENVVLMHIEDQATGRMIKHERIVSIHY